MAQNLTRAAGADAQIASAIQRLIPRDAEEMLAELWGGTFHREQAANFKTDTKTTNPKEK